MRNILLTAFIFFIFFLLSHSQTTGNFKISSVEIIKNKSIAVEVSGGKAPFIYYLKDIKKVKTDETSLTFKKLQPGKYWIIVEDANQESTYKYPIIIKDINKFKE